MRHPTASHPASSKCPVTDIIPDPRQPRTVIDAAALAELSASIREHGLIQPLIVSPHRAANHAAYQLIAGERRWRAAQLAGLTAVPVVIKEATPQQSLELALVEFIRRADLNPLEEAEAFQALISDFGLSQQEVADRVGKSRVAVANVVRLLRLPERVKVLLAQGTLTEGHARALLGLEEDGAHHPSCRAGSYRGLNVRETEDLVRRLLAAAPPTPIWQTRSRTMTRTPCTPASSKQPSAPPSAPRWPSAGAGVAGNWSSLSSPMKNYRRFTRGSSAEIYESVR